MNSLRQAAPIILIAFFLNPVRAQKKGLESISTHDLKMHMEFLASDELEGRNTGEPGLQIAARYLAVQARRLGLQPADPDNDFFQLFTILERAYDREHSQAAIITPGSDPVLKNEVVIYVAHFDHLGTDGRGGVFNGADDNASGTVALIEIAEAFMKEKKRPGRSVGFLWVSAEEIGLFGSQYFAGNPLIPTGKTSAVINLDMLGRTKTVEDETCSMQGLTIMGGDTVKVIGGLQSVVLMDINKKTLEEMDMYGNYTYNDPDHPDRYFYRSDHISFARKDIPVLFYSTGTHRDYHQVTDIEERIDYNKFLKMTRFCYKVGLNVAQYKNPIEVDNPFSSW